MLDAGRKARLEVANGMIRIISEHGRKFFAHSNGLSHFELDQVTGRLWFIDGYTHKRIYTAYRRGRWRGFSDGGTLRALIENMSDFIMKGDPIRAHFGPWRKELCDGDLWGYGDSMQAVRDEIKALTTSKQEVSG
jgi:hypothetical protein